MPSEWPNDAPVWEFIQELLDEHDEVLYPIDAIKAMYMAWLKDQQKHGRYKCNKL